MQVYATILTTDTTTVYTVLTTDTTTVYTILTTDTTTVYTIVHIYVALLLVTNSTNQNALFKTVKVNKETTCRLLNV